MKREKQEADEMRKALWQTMKANEMKPIEVAEFAGMSYQVFRKLLRDKDRDISLANYLRLKNAIEDFGSPRCVDATF